MNIAQAKLSSLVALRDSPLIALSLNNSLVTDISPLSELAKLRSHSFDANQVTDLLPLTTVPLEHLSAKNNQNKDLSPLGDTTKDEVLPNLCEGYSPQFRIIGDGGDCGVCELLK